MKNLISILKGGPGSGNFGHAGRPGEVGGSGSGEGGFPPIRHHAERSAPGLAKLSDALGQLQSFDETKATSSAAESHLKKVLARIDRSLGQADLERVGFKHESRSSALFDQIDSIRDNLESNPLLSDDNSNRLDKASLNRYRTIKAKLQDLGSRVRQQLIRVHQTPNA